MWVLLKLTVSQHLPPTQREITLVFFHCSPHHYANPIHSETTRTKWRIRPHRPRACCSASLDAKRRAINLQASALLNLRAKTEAAIRESNDKHCLFSYSNGWEENSSRQDGSPLSCRIAKPNAQAFINSYGTGTHGKPHQGLDIWQDAEEVVTKHPTSVSFLNARASSCHGALGDGNTYRAALHQSEAPASSISPMKWNQQLSPIVA